MSKIQESIRSQYVEYIAEGMGYSLAESGLKFWPDDTYIVVVDTSSPLIDFDKLMDIPVIISDIPSSYEFFMAIGKPEKSEDLKLLTYFKEYMSLHSIFTKGC